jgi:hypothetical protein
MRKLWLYVFVLAGIIAALGWVSFLAWLALKAISPMFA